MQLTSHLAKGHLGYGKGRWSSGQQAAQHATHLPCLGGMADALIPLQHHIFITHMHHPTHHTTTKNIHEPVRHCNNTRRAVVMSYY